MNSYKSEKFCNKHFEQFHLPTLYIILVLYLRFNYTLVIHFVGIFNTTIKLYQGKAPISELDFLESYNFPNFSYE